VLGHGSQWPRGGGLSQLSSVVIEIARRRGAKMLGKRLMLVDADVDALSDVSEALGDAGHEVLIACSGREALQMLHGPIALDLVLLAMRLPDMNAEALLATRTRWPTGASLPVLLLCDDDGISDESAVLRQAGVVGVLRKPLAPQQLLAAIERALDAASSWPAPPIRGAPARPTRRLADLLVRTSEILAQSVDVRSDLRELARMLVPSACDFCVFERADAAGGERRVLCALARDEVDPILLQPLLARGEGLLRVVSDVLESGEARSFDAIDRADLAELAHDAADADVLARLQLDSLIVVPMLARRRVFGTLTWCSFGTQRRYGQAQVDAASDLAHRVALALDNEQLARSTQEAVRAREQLLAVLTHDLRTPLSAIAVTATRLLQSGAAVDGDAAAIILRNARRMEQHLRDLLDRAQLDAGSLRVELRQERIVDVLRDALASKLALTGRHEVHGDFSETLRDLILPCDAARIQQVVAILVGSAARDTSGQDTRHISVRLRQVDGEVRVSVGTSAHAFGKEQVSGLFDRTAPNRAPANVDRHGLRDDHGGHGVGLDLSIARGLIEAHGGRLWAQSEPDTGSAFHFTLRPSPSELEHRTLDRGRPILLVDDDLAFRRELQEILVERGYAVDTADDGWQAWSYLQANEPPALILLDLMMPVMDGWDLHAAIKSHPVLASVPTVIVSCLDRYRIEPSLIDVQGYIEKPIRTAQLFDVVQRHVSSPALARAHGAQGGIRV
jgi:CheY-like chemotaxis protein/GAF domain-containing protein